MDTIKIAMTEQDYFNDYGCLPDLNKPIKWLKIQVLAREDYHREYNKQIRNGELKTCIHCKPKPLMCFDKDPGRKDGLKSVCKTCCSKQNKARNKKFANMRTT